MTSTSNAPTAAAAGFKIGDAVIITARTDWTAYIDGWTGRVAGFHGGHVIVKVTHEGTEKTFYVPPEELRLTVGAAV